jgi:hypothetical protein
MQEDKLRQLLAQMEGVTLEFKQELHAIDHPNGQAAARLRHELIKDLLALANGNASTAGEAAYLIFGAGDIIGPDGHRPLFDVPDPLPDRQRLLGLVNAVCSPRLEELICTPFVLDGHRLFVVTIPATAQLYETTHQLITPDRHFTEHVVFIREGQSIKVANDREREAIRTMKRVRAMEQQNAPPRRFGTISGAFVGGTVMQMQMERQGATPNERIIAGISGTILGALVGAASGEVFRGLVRFQRDVQYIPTPWRYAAYPGLLLFVAAFQTTVSRLLRALRLLPEPRKRSG